MNKLYHVLHFRFYLLRSQQTAHSHSSLRRWEGTRILRRCCLRFSRRQAESLLRTRTGSTGTQCPMRVTGGGISTFMSHRQSLSRQLLTAAIAAGSVTRQSDLQFLKAEFPICDTDGGAATRTSRKPKTRLIPPAECVVADSRQRRRQRCPPQRSEADERARLDLCDGRRRIEFCQRGALFKCVHLHFLL